MTLRFVHISDTHIDLPVEKGGPFLLNGVDTKRHFEQLIAEIESLVAAGLPLDFVVHTGDLCNSCDVPAADAASAKNEAFDIASDLLASLSVPCLLLNGNHDRVDLVEQRFGPLAISNASTFSLGNQGTRSSVLQLDDYLLVFLDARPRITNDNTDFDTRHADDPAGFLLPEELATLEATFNKTQQDILVFLHYPPVPLDCIWMDESMLISNGDSLHQLLKTVSDRVRGVFFGHVHHSIQMLHDQIMYVAAGSVSCTFPAWPHASNFRDAVSQYNVSKQAWYNYVSVDKSSTSIKQQTLQLSQD